MDKSNLKAYAMTGQTLGRTTFNHKVTGDMTMSITFEERLRLLEIMSEANELGLVTETEREQARGGPEALITHMYECERRVIAYKAKAVKAKYMHTLDPSSNWLLGESLDKVWDRLDFGPRDAALTKLDHKLGSELQAEINSVLSDYIDAAFALGWQAAKNPAEWLFGSNSPDDRLTQQSPLDTFDKKMVALGFGNEDIYCLEGDLGEAVVHLLCDAQRLAFRLGWDLQHNPESLIFASESEAQ